MRKNIRRFACKKSLIIVELLRGEKMKFIHIADTHFDSIFTNLSDKKGQGDIVRLEQRKVFKRVIEYIKENEIPFLFISGDLYEQKYIRKSTIEYINNLFKEIPDTKIFIAPGNHDPYIKNSYYNQFEWNENVKIFSDKLEKVDLGEVDIYGYGFGDFYCDDCGISDLEIENKNKINILVIHADLDGSQNSEQNYNSISKNILKEKGFDYCALGHIHKSNYEEENQNIVYPGSTVSLGFDELGEHGMVLGDIEKNDIKVQFIPLKQIGFEEIEVDCTELSSLEDLVEKINELKLEKSKFYKIILTGKRNFEINIYDLFKLNLDDKIIKIKNKTKLNYDLDKIKDENTLKGLFVKEVMKRLNEARDQEEIEKLEKSLEIGLEVLE